jgi:hypothetical protein
MKIAIALCFVLGLASVSNAQCLNGTCNLIPKVAATVQRILTVVHNDFEYAAPVVSEVSQDCGCQGQCGKTGCTCAPVAVATPVVASVEYQAVAVAARTPVRTILRSPFGARPLQRLFSRCR